MSLRAAISLVVTSACLAGCGERSAESESQPPMTLATNGVSNEAAAPATPAGDSLEARVLRVAAEYEAWPSVYLNPHWAPTYCSPIGAAPVLSEAKEDSPHGRKLYYLYTSDNGRYEALGAEPGNEPEFPPGFALVKESWTPVPLGHDEYEPGEKGALFVMLRVEVPIESDEGWVYATLSPDGTEVHGVGRVESCMGCHAKAPYGRLFGPVEGARTNRSWLREAIESERP